MSGGVKNDAGKAPLSMIPRSALLAEARVMAHGAAKYGRDNWRKGMNWTRVIDALQRHAVAIAAGEDFDDGPEGTGELHAANIRCCAAFLIEYHEQGLGTDDRHTAAPKPPGDAGMRLVTLDTTSGSSWAWPGYSCALTSDYALIRLPPNREFRKGVCVWARPLDACGDLDFVSEFCPSLPDDGQDTP